uniref:Uncharacterized protein n=1 Tax=Ananas comosus var. bracteatus TaxID=296719 RepID=A0A6V7QWR1_ANACO
MSEEELKSKTKKKKKKIAEAEVLSWQEQKKIADAEEATVRSEVDEFVSWTTMIEAMDDKELKEYALNKPDSLQSVRRGKDALKKTKRNGKARPSSPSSLGIMATVWKFHTEGDEEASNTNQI